jgi:hypothetical protein
MPSTTADGSVKARKPLNDKLFYPSERAGTAKSVAVGLR